MMKKLISVTALSATFLIAPVHAENNDALWKSVTAQLEVSRKWAAGVIDVISDVDKGNGVRHMSATMHLSGWEKQKPVYTTVKKQPEEKAIDLTFLNGITAISTSMTEDETPTRTDGVALDGVTCTVFESQFSKALNKGTMKLWVDAGTNKLRQMVLIFHSPFFADGTVITHYVAGAQGQVLPGVVDYDLNILIPFRNAKIRIQQASSAWVAVPKAD